MRQSVTTSITRLRLLSVVLGLCVSRCSVAVAQAQTQDTVIYYHTDAIGSVRMITDANGQVIARYDYLPFGESWAPLSNRDVRQFAGKERDAETGLDYFGARYYSSGIGRFTTADSSIASLDAAIMEPQLWNRYVYVSNNPLRKVDPDGRWERDVHYELTRALAAVAGFSPQAAAAIAFANEFTDANPATSPMGLEPWGAAVERRQLFHFTTLDRRRAMWDAFMSTRTPNDLGMFLHAEQDSYSHSAFEARLGQAPLWLLGGTSVAKLPDKTRFIPSRADAMAQDAYGWLVVAARVSHAGSSVSWEKISPFVQRFNREQSSDRKREILDEMLKSIQDP